jgi:phosphoribosylanthranilate isomerase
MTRVKVCGITNLQDALAAVAAGADAVGLVFADSPRMVSLAAAEQIVAGLPPLITTIGVFVDTDVLEVAAIAERARLSAVQLHGEESPEYCDHLPLKIIKRFDILESDTPGTLRRRMQQYRVASYLLDPGAGGGRTFNWSLAHGLPGPLIISGGLNPENVGTAVRLLRPFAVDVSSGVELQPGCKDADMLRAFVQAVRDADANHRDA